MKYSVETDSGAKIDSERGDSKTHTDTMVIS
jgi:hypothetical protein